VEKHILPELGPLTLDALTAARLDLFFRNKLIHGRLDGKGGLALKTVADLRGILKLIFHYARTHGYLEAEPDMPSVGRTVQEPRTLTRTEQKKLEETLFQSTDPVRFGILIALYGGLRIGEVCALQWGDLDFENGTVRVCKTLLRIRDVSSGAQKKTKVVIDTPKTQTSNRLVPLPAFLMAYLYIYKRGENVYLLTGTPGFMEPRACLDKYKKLLQAAQVSSHTFHALRHTFATRCIENEVDLKSLSEIMGHSSVNITMQRYVHPSMDLKKAQMNKLTPLVD